MCAIRRLGSAPHAGTRDQSTYLLYRLRNALQALAAPAEVQLGLFPDFVCKVDELEFEVWHWRDCVVTNPMFRLTSRQRAVLAAIDAYRVTLNDADEWLWTEHALRWRPEWEDMRQLAKAALAAFRWEAVPPSGFRAGDWYGPAGPRRD